MLQFPTILYRFFPLNRQVWRTLLLNTHNCSHFKHVESTSRFIGGHQVVYWEVSFYFYLLFLKACFSFIAHVAYDDFFLAYFLAHQNGLDLWNSGRGRRGEYWQDINAEKSSWTVHTTRLWMFRFVTSFAKIFSLTIYIVFCGISCPSTLTSCWKWYANEIFLMDVLPRNFILFFCLLSSLYRS